MFLLLTFHHLLAAKQEVETNSQNGSIVNIPTALL